MQLPRVPDRFRLIANDADVDLPPEVEVRDCRGKRVACYSLREVVGVCGKDAERSCGVAVDSPPVAFEVVEACLPERFSLELENAGPCNRHGWDCPHWVRSAVYARN